MKTRWPFRIALVLAVAAAPLTAHAEEPRESGQTKGRELFNEAVVLFNQNNFAAACPKLEQSLAYYPGIGTRGKLAECYEKVGRYASAWNMYREVAELSSKNNESARERVARERQRALEPKLSYVEIVIGTAADVSGLVVLRNGQEIDRTRLTRTEPLDPGVIHLELSAPGRKRFATKLQLAAGQRIRFDAPVLEVTDPNAPSAASDPAFTWSAERDERSWQRPLAFAVGGTGIAALVVGGAFGLSARSSYEGAFDRGACARGTRLCDPTGQQEVDDARTKATVSTVLVAAGGAMIVGGVILLLTAPSPAPTSAALKNVRVAPSFDPFTRSAGLSFGGTL